MSPSGAAPLSSPAATGCGAASVAASATVRSDSAWRRAFRRARAAACSKDGDRAVPQDPALPTARSATSHSSTASGRTARGGVPRQRASAGSAGTPSAGTKPAACPSTASSATVELGARASSGRPAPPARTKPSPSGRKTATASAPRRVAASDATTAAVRAGSRLAKSPAGVAGSSAPLGFREQGRAEAIRRHDQRADRIGLERNRPPPPDQEGAGRPAGGGMNRDRQRGAEAVLVEQGVGSAQARAPPAPPRRHGSPARRCRRPREARAAGGSPAERATVSDLSPDSWRIAAQSARACVRARSIARRQASDRLVPRPMARRLWRPARRARVGSSSRAPGGAFAAAIPTASASASRRRVMPARAFRMSPSDPSSALTVGSIGTGRGAVNGPSGPEWRRREVAGADVLGGRSVGTPTGPPRHPASELVSRPRRTSEATKTRRRPRHRTAGRGRRRSNERRSYFLSVRM